MFTLDITQLLPPHDSDHPLVDALILLVSQVVLISLLAHGDHHHEQQRQQPGLWTDGRVNDPSQNQSNLNKLNQFFKNFFPFSYKEVEVGNSSELLQKVERDEGYQTVF